MERTQLFDLMGELKLYEGSILIRLRRPEPRVRQSRQQGYHRPNQGCAGGASECSVDRRASDHHGSHGRRKTEEGKCGPRHARRWHGRYGRYGLLERSPRPKRWRPGISPGLFSYSTCRCIRGHSNEGALPPSVFNPGCVSALAGGPAKAPGTRRAACVRGDRTRRLRLQARTAASRLLLPRSC